MTCPSPTSCQAKKSPAYCPAPSKRLQSDLLKEKCGEGKSSDADEADLYAFYRGHAITCFHEDEYADALKADFHE